MHIKHKDTLPQHWLTLSVGHLLWGVTPSVSVHCQLTLQITFYLPAFVCVEASTGNHTSTVCITAVMDGAISLQSVSYVCPELSQTVTGHKWNWLNPDCTSSWNMDSFHSLTHFSHFEFSSSWLRSVWPVTACLCYSSSSLYFLTFITTLHCFPVLDLCSLNIFEFWNVGPAKQTIWGRLFWFWHFSTYPHSLIIWYQPGQSVNPETNKIISKLLLTELQPDFVVVSLWKQHFRSKVNISSPEWDPEM